MEVELAGDLQEEFEWVGVQRTRALVVASNRWLSIGGTLRLGSGEGHTWRVSTVRGTAVWLEREGRGLMPATEFCTGQAGLEHGPARMDLRDLRFSSTFSFFHHRGRP